MFLLRDFVEKKAAEMREGCLIWDWQHLTGCICCFEHQISTRATLYLVRPSFWLVLLCSSDVNSPSSLRWPANSSASWLFRRALPQPLDTDKSSAPSVQWHWWLQRCQPGVQPAQEGPGARPATKQSTVWLTLNCWQYLSAISMTEESRLFSLSSQRGESETLLRGLW